MQKKLSIIILLLISSFIIIGIILIFSLTNSTTSHTQRITLNSQIPPYVVTFNPGLDIELEKMGYWSRNNRFPTNKPAKKMTINIMYIAGVDENVLSYSLTNNGVAYTGGTSKLGSDGDPIINMYVSDATLGAKTSAKRLDALFWQLFYITYINPSSLETDQFIKTQLSKIDVFSLKK